MKKVSLLITLLIVSQLIFAWGKAGHQIIGHLADQYLTEKTKAEIIKILGDESLSDASTWVDEMLNDSHYENLNNWHYAYRDTEIDDNAIHKFDEFVKVLQDENASAKDRVLAMRVLTHIVGDMHSPIHCGYMKDAGGHKVKLVWKHPHSKTNLHKVWDTDMIHMKMLDVNAYSAQLTANITDDNRSEWGNADAKIWVLESQSYLDQAYDITHGHLEKDYYNKNIVTVDLRMSKAGVRLAYVLNMIFDSNM